jgi:O-antigen/teichoic acid export membrane protein
MIETEKFVVLCNITDIAEEEAMSKKTTSLVLIIGGLILAILSLTADLIGLGTYEGFAWSQIVGTVVGVAVAIYGYWVGRRQPVEKK